MNIKTKQVVDETIYIMLNKKLWTSVYLGEAKRVHSGTENNEFTGFSILLLSIVLITQIKSLQFFCEMHIIEK